MIEAALAVVVVSVVMIWSLEAAATSTRAQYSMQDRSIGAQLAESLLAEVISRSYATPTDTTGLLGVPARPSDRINYLSIDSYIAFTESPPASRDGTAITDNSWTRRVTIDFVNPATPTTTSATDQSLKRITVTVSKSGRTVATRIGLAAK